MDAPLSHDAPLPLELRLGAEGGGVVGAVGPPAKGPAVRAGGEVYGLAVGVVLGETGEAAVSALGKTAATLSGSLEDQSHAVADYVR